MSGDPPRREESVEGGDAHTWHRTARARLGRRRAAPRPCGGRISTAHTARPVPSAHARKAEANHADPIRSEARRCAARDLIRSDARRRAGMRGWRDHCNRRTPCNDLFPELIAKYPCGRPQRKKREIAREREGERSPTRLFIGIRGCPHSQLPTNHTTNRRHGSRTAGAQGCSNPVRQQFITALQNRRMRWVHQ
eukprot:350353-Chlamydomonas_euryale.AAC.5